MCIAVLIFQTINIETFKGGVSKLNEAKTLVSELKQKAAEQEEKLAEKQSKANAALDMISNTIKGANAHKEEMEVLKRKTESENIQLVKRFFLNNLYIQTIIALVAKQESGD